MRKMKSPQESSVSSRKQVAANQTNSQGFLSAGVLMAWMDHMACMSAKRFADAPQVITLNVDQIHFKTLVSLGEQVILSSSVELASRKSMEVGVIVERENPVTKSKEFAASASFTFIALNSKSKSIAVPRLVPKTDHEIERYEKARVRIKVRGRLRRWIDERFPKVMAMRSTVVETAWEA
jgi:acyl-CoA hydrolase